MSWHKPESIAEEMLAKTILEPLSGLYSLASTFRAKAYAHGLFKQSKLNIPVISVGNLSVGGTGKTPLTIDLAKRLIKSGHKVAILSRGYKRKSQAKIIVVSAGKGLLATAQEAGDEPYLIAKSVPEAIVIVGSKRRDTALLAAQKYGCSIILLDDGFQHLALKRTSNIVLIDYNDDLQNMKILPAGRLREPLSALRRADWIVISKLPKNPNQEQQQKLKQIEQTIKQYAPQAKITHCYFECDSIKRLYAKENATVHTSIKELAVYAFCSIARPEGFFHTVEELGANIVGKQIFPDHHWLSDTDLKTLTRGFEESGAKLIITTEKDGVRLPEELFANLPVSELQLSCHWLGEIPLDTALNDTSLNLLNQARGNS